MKQDMRKMIKRLKKAGWTATPTGSGHLRLEGPHGERQIVPATPSDHRALKNMRADIRRASKAAGGVVVL